YVHGGQAFGGGAVPDLAVEVVAPALHAARGGDGASVREPGGDGRHSARQARDADRSRASGCGAVPELAVAVVAPAFHPSHGGEGAGVVVAGGYGRHAAAEAGDVDRGRGPRRAAGPQLAVAVVAPALHPSPGGESARVDEAGGDGRDPAGEAGGV